MEEHKLPTNEEAIALLRRAVPKLQPTDDDATLNRFLRARSGDISQTITMLTQFTEWREEFKPETIVPSEFPASVQTCQAFIGGTSKSGHPSIVVSPARYLPNLLPVPLQVRYVVWIFHRVMDRLVPPIETFHVILDLAGFGMKNMSFQFIKSVMHILQNYYPERLQGLQVINAPFFFRGIYALVKPLLSAETTAKIAFCTPPQLLDVFDPEQLPDFLGGTFVHYPHPGDPVERILPFYSPLPPAGPVPRPVVQPGDQAPPPAPLQEGTQEALDPAEEVLLSAALAEADMGADALARFRAEALHRSVPSSPGGTRRVLPATPAWFVPPEKRPAPAPAWKVPPPAQDTEETPPDG